MSILKSFDKCIVMRYAGLLETRSEDLYVKHEARRVVREGQHGHTDGRKSNARAAAGRWAARMGCGRGI